MTYTNEHVLSLIKFLCEYFQNNIDDFNVKEITALINALSLLIKENAIASTYELQISNV